MALFASLEGKGGEGRVLKKKEGASGKNRLV
jgi:hypothetical protein